MSYLAVEKFDNDTPVIETSIRVYDTKNIYALRMYVYKKGTLSDGTITLEIKDGTDVVATSTMTHTQINTIDGTYAHGMLNFELSNPFRVNLDENTDYVTLTLTFTMSGHTEDINNYISFVRDFENSFIDEFGDRPELSNPQIDGWYNPFKTEIYTLY